MGKHFAVLFLCFFSIKPYSHEGEVDSHGCHTNIKTGVYHCHNQSEERENADGAVSDITQGHGQSEERKNLNGTVSDITPVISAHFSELANKKVYYAGGHSGRRYEQVDFLKPVPGNEFEKCNIEIGTELTLLGQQYVLKDIPVLLAQITDPSLQGKGYSKLCGFQSHIFVQQETLSWTRPAYTPHNYYDDYTLFRARDLSKGRIVYFNPETQTSSWAEIKNADHWFHPERDIAYINRCIVLTDPKFQIHGFSQDGNFVLLEVLDDGWPGAACQKGHEIVLPTEDIDWSHPKEEICEDIYRYSAHRNNCNRQSFFSVRLLDEIDEIFANADVEELEIDSGLSGALQMYVGIDIDPLVRNAMRYTTREAKKLLAWLAWPGLTDSPDENTLIAVNAILEADGGGSNHRLRTAHLLQELLERAALLKGYSTPEDLVKAFNQVIYESQDQKGKTHSYTFLDLIQRSQNEGAWQWVHFFMEEGLCESVDEDDGGLMAPGEAERGCMLRTYCALSETMSDETAKVLADFEHFKKFIDDIVLNEVNKTNWSRQDIHSSMEESLVWHKDLCGTPSQ